MDSDIKSQVDRSKKLFEELEKACNDDLEKQNVSGETKNLAQETLLKIRHLLDQAFYQFFKKYYLPHLSEIDKKSAKVYCPLVTKKEDLKSVLGMARMGTLEIDHPKFYELVESFQPYNSDYLWLDFLSKLAIDKHIKLTPQIKKESKTMTASVDGASITMPIDDPNFSIHQGEGAQIFFGGVPIKFTSQGIVPLAPGLKTETTKWVSFLFEDLNVNVLWLCGKAVKDGEEIIKKISEFI